MRIASVVYNSVLHDSRVIKEAESLKKAGYEISIFGITDNKTSQKYYTTQQGVDVILANWKRYYFNRMYYILKYLCAVILLLFISFSFFVKKSIHYYEFIILVNIVLFSIFMFCFLYFYKRKINHLIGHNNGFNKLEMGEGKKIEYFRKLGRFLYSLIKLNTFKSAIVNEITKYDPDIVHCHDLHAVPVGLKFKKIYNAKVVYDSHEIYTELSNNLYIKKIFYTLYEKIISSRIDVFITVNDSIASFLEKKYPKIPKATVVKNATKIEKLESNYDGRLHKAAGLELNKKILLYQGGFSDGRGLIKFVKSGPYLPEPWHIVLMGWGALEPVLRAVVNKIDPNGTKIKFIPPAPQNELNLWTQGATVGVIPYENNSLNHYYCSPNKLWEYPVAKVPLLVSPFPELKKIIEYYKIGWLLNDPLSSSFIVDFIIALKDEEILHAKNACEKFINEDNWEKYEKRLIRIYKNFEISTAKFY